LLFHKDITIFFKGKERCVIPRYEFECEKCQCVYDIWSSIAEKEQNVKKGKCPKCKSKKKKEIMGFQSFNFGNPVGSDKWNNSHDYRFKHEMEKPGGVREQRADAEKKSHVGATPYRDINDLGNDKNWGEVR